jgi:hypothetical protein
MRLYLKNTQSTPPSPQKSNGGIAKIAEQLPNKHETLSSNHSTTGKKKKSHVAEPGGAQL